MNVIRAGDASAKPLLAGDFPMRRPGRFPVNNVGTHTINERAKGLD